MKKQLLTSLCIISLFCACSNQANKKEIVLDPANELNRQKTDSLQKIAESSTESVSELPLNYSFSMTEDECYKHTNKLVEKKILSKSDKDYIYVFKTNRSINVESKLIFWFHGDRLYNLNFKLVRSYNYDLASKDRDRLDSISQAAIEDDLYSKINSSYLKTSYFDYDPVSLGGTMYIADWIKNNQIIEFKKFYPLMMEAEISYINAPINKIVFNAELDKLNDESRARLRMKEAGIENSTYDGSVSKVEAYLKSNLKDVSSYQSVEWSNVTPTDNGYMVRHKYRAKNSFGAYELVNQVFYLNSNGEVISVSDYK